MRGGRLGIDAARARSEVGERDERERREKGAPVLCPEQQCDRKDEVPAKLDRERPERRIDEGGVTVEEEQRFEHVEHGRGRRHAARQTQPRVIEHGDGDEADQRRDEIGRHDPHDPVRGVAHMSKEADPVLAIRLSVGYARQNPEMTKKRSTP